MNRLDSQEKALLHKARVTLYAHRLLAKKAGVALDYGLRELEQLIACSPCCTYCETPVDFSLQVDHVLPVARFGALAQRKNNLAVCCSRCNAMKGQLTGQEFLALLVLLKDFHPNARADVERRLLAGGKCYAASRERSVP